MSPLRKIETRGLTRSEVSRTVPNFATIDIEPEALVLRGDHVVLWVRSVETLQTFSAKTNTGHIVTLCGQSENVNTGRRP
jgi:hypothetical protein